MARILSVLFVVPGWWSVRQCVASVYARRPLYLAPVFSRGAADAIISTALFERGNSVF